MSPWFHKYLIRRLLFDLKLIFLLIYLADFVFELVLIELCPPLVCFRDRKPSRFLVGSRPQSR